MTTIYDFHEAVESLNGDFAVRRRTCWNEPDAEGVPHILENLDVMVGFDTEKDALVHAILRNLEMGPNHIPHPLSGKTRHDAVEPAR